MARSSRRRNQKRSSSWPCSTTATTYPTTRTPISPPLGRSTCLFLSRASAIAQNLSGPFASRSASNSTLPRRQHLPLDGVACTVAARRPEQHERALLPREWARDAPTSGPVGEPSHEGLTDEESTGSETTSPSKCEFEQLPLGKGASLDAAIERQLRNQAVQERLLRTQEQLLAALGDRLVPGQPQLEQPCSDPGRELRGLFTERRRRAAPLDMSLAEAVLAAEGRGRTMRARSVVQSAGR
jgi:hypothetical protein